MKEKPYIGISCVDSAQNAQHLVALVRHAYELHASKQPLALGTAIRFDGNTRYFGARYLSNQEISEISNVISSPVVSIGHFSQANPKKRKRLPEMVQEYLHYMKSEFGMKYNLAQINGMLPSISQLERMQKTHPEMDVVVTINTKDYSISALQNLKHYRGLIKHVLVDDSGGRGQEFNFKQVEPMYDALATYLPDVVVGISGGLTPTNIKENIKRLTSEKPGKPFSFDVETGVRNEQNDFDVEKAVAFIQEAYTELFHEYE